ncbi:c-type cytochrome [Phenylobacterium soli]|nr:cytochrome c [Phenylobacterium soli]
MTAHAGARTAVAAMTFVVTLFAAAHPARPETRSAAIARGQELAATYCAGCHSINPVGASVYRAAPPFRDLPPIPPHALQARLKLLLGNPHYGMPQRFLTLSESEDLAAFMQSLKAPAAKDRRLRARPCIATAC